jgi:predicted aconitase with swiveling domain
MSRTFAGRAILAGDIEGEARVSMTGFNTYASFYNSLTSPAESALCADSGNEALYGKDLAGKVLCIPNTIGSTSAGAVWQRVATLGVAPKAVLFANPIDSLAAAGLIVSDVWAGKRIVTADQLGEAFLDSVTDGDWVRVCADGTVTVV